MKEPLDYTEVKEPAGNEVPKDRIRLSVILEILPLSLLALGLFLSYQNNPNWRIIFASGAVLTAIIFLVNNWLLLWQANYGQLEYGLSIFSSIYFIVAIGAIYYQFFNLEAAHTWSAIARWMGTLLLAFTTGGFLLRMKDPAYSNFYRRLLARVLVIFAVLIKGLF